MAEKTIAAFVVTNIEDKTQQHRVEISPGRRSPDNWHARKVESGLFQRVDWERWFIVTEYDDGTTDGEG